MARIAIDLHGGDFGPSILIPSSFQFFQDNPHHHGVLVGQSKSFRSFVRQCPQNIEFIDANPLGDEASRPSRLLRKTGTSSIETCFRMLEMQDVDTLVSAEHTGVLLALISKYGQLHALINRPVLASWLPGLNKSTLMLDLGASYFANHEQLLAYTAIGIGIKKSQTNSPAVGLLNLGTEQFKGPPELRLADAALHKWSDLNYKGFIEASSVFKGDLDVIVTDGFTGNSVIKSAEGALDLTLSILKNKLNHGVFSRLLAFWLKQQLKSSLKKLDPRLSNGALVCGSNLQVIKSHGNARGKAFYTAIERAASAHSGQYTTSIWVQLDKLFDELA